MVLQEGFEQAPLGAGPPVEPNNGDCVGFAMTIDPLHLAAVGFLASQHVLKSVPEWHLTVLGGIFG